ncbi:RHS repeat-associated core domain-containing protein [Streptomyces sp. NPDC101237]|uniref:RHS repeat-associated core domain-containing protein n=1 Tax=Streptomyces sp. NPDC101237 TaxID=3366139 RepID=UPI0037F2EAFD
MKWASTTLIWNELGQLVQTTGASATSYVYDADGSLLLRTGSAATVLYLGGQEIRKVGSTITGTRYYADGASTVAMRTSGTGAAVTRLMSDSQASTSVAVDSTTNTVTRRRYLPFGAQRSGSLPSGTDHGFLGKSEDSDTGLSVLGARMYDNKLGRFISTDPLRTPYTPQNMNLYSYAMNNPIAYSDPTGLEPHGDPCLYDLSDCPSSVQESVGYDPGSGKVYPEKGTAVGDGSINEWIASGKKQDTSKKLSEKTFDWLKKNLGYTGSQYMSRGEAAAWLDNAKDEWKGAINAFAGCYVLSTQSSDQCKKAVQKDYKDVFEKDEDKPWWSTAWDHAKEHIGDVVAIGLTIGCTAGIAFATGGVGVVAATGCATVAAAIGGAINYGMSDDKKTLGGYVEATAWPAATSLVTVGTAGTATSLTARSALSGAAFRTMLGFWRRRESWSGLGLRARVRPYIARREQENNGPNQTDILRA